MICHFARSCRVYRKDGEACNDREKARKNCQINKKIMGEA